MENKIDTSSWQSITENMGDTHLDFSVNINPLGVPNIVKQQLANLADIAGIYPDPECKYLSSCLAKNIILTQTRFYVVMAQTIYYIV